MNPWKDPNSSTKKPAPTVPTIAANVPAVRHIPINKMYTVRNDFCLLVWDPLFILRLITYKMVQINYLHLTNSGNQMCVEGELESVPCSTPEYSGAISWNKRI